METYPSAVLSKKCNLTSYYSLTRKEIREGKKKKHQNNRSIDHDCFNGVVSPKQPSKLFKCIRCTRRHHATSMRRWTYRRSEVVTDLVCEGDVRNRRWYVFAVVQEGDYTGVQRFHATPVVLQDEIALVLEVIVWVSWMRRGTMLF